MISKKSKLERQADEILRRLGDYKCEGQMSFEDVDWEALHKKEKEPMELEEPEI